MDDVNPSKEIFSLKKKSLDISKYLHAIMKYRIIIILVGVLLIFQFAVIFMLYKQNQSQERTYKLNFQYIFSVNQTISQKNRKQNCINMIMKVALKYNKNLNEVALVKIANLIYEIGELRYDIPTEEWIILFTLESEWNPKAVSKSGAKGLGQLMPVIAMYNAKMLNITWRGDKTLFNPEENPRLSMRYYFDLKHQYEKPIYYISAYNWGEKEIGYFYRNDKKLIGKYLDYYKKYLKAKKEVEKILGKKIIINGL